jgi:Uma2 family endonuclease
MIAVREQFPRFTPEEYFAWEELQNCRHEYIDGEVYAMTGGTINHGQISANFITILRNHLRGSGCKVLSSDARVNIHASNNYVYPDVSVTCDERDKTATQSILYPCLIIEILSPGTEAYDRGNKFAMYRRNPCLRDYVLVNADQIAIEIYHRGQDSKWDILNYRAEDNIELKSVDLTFAIEQVYEDIIFPQ